MKLSSWTTSFLAAMLSASAAYAASPVANVYVPTQSGIHAYSASAAGKLTEIKGSPFKQTVGLAIASNQSYFITLGTNLVHSYKVGADGSIGAQVSQIDTRLYSGSECGTTNGATLDHTGKYLYVRMDVSELNIPCRVYQTYAVGNAGTLTFVGVSDDISHVGMPGQTPLDIAGNNQHAYSAPEWAANYTTPASGCNPYLDSFSFGATGALGFSTHGGGIYGPTANPAGGGSLPPVPWLITNDPTDHLAIAVFDSTNVNNGPGCGIGAPIQLASFTVDIDGNITSTNTWENMPTLSGATSLRLNKAGTVLAVATGPGVELFHFNGDQPITPFTGTLGATGSITKLDWDTSNHLYALNGPTGTLHIYNVTAAGATEAAGAPYTLPVGASNVLAVSK